MCPPDEVLDAFARRHAQTHWSAADRRRKNAELLGTMRGEIPVTVAKLRANGFPEYTSDKRYQAQQATINGRAGIVWPRPDEETGGALGLYVDGTMSPPEGKIVITDDFAGGNYRFATDNELLDLPYETLNAIVNGLLKVLRDAPKTPGYELPDVHDVNPDWAKMTINP